jgi:hypothetical protein
MIMMRGERTWKGQVNEKSLFTIVLPGARCFSLTGSRGVER